MMLDNYIVVRKFGSAYALRQGELVQIPLDKSGNPVPNTYHAVDFELGVEDQDVTLLRAVKDTLEALDAAPAPTVPDEEQQRRDRQSLGGF